MARAAARPMPSPRAARPRVGCGGRNRHMGRDQPSAALRHMGAPARPRRAALPRGDTVDGGGRREDAQPHGGRRVPAGAGGRRQPPLPGAGRLRVRAQPRLPVPAELPAAPRLQAAGERSAGRDSRAGSLQSAGPGAGSAQPSGARGERRWGRGERAPAAFAAASPGRLLGHCWPRAAAGALLGQGGCWGTAGPAWLLGQLEASPSPGWLGPPEAEALGA